MPLTSEPTTFSRDVLGRFVCDTLGEALASSDQTVDPTVRPRPLNRLRPFDIIVVGGGSFGGAIAERLLAEDRTRTHRVLVLVAGPFVLTGHVQNFPVLGLNPAGSTSIQDLRAANQFGLDKPREEVWGLPWHSPVKFPGLAYCVGGRSLYWGGWSPEPVPEEMPTAGVPNPWPAAVVADLTGQYFRAASNQMGVTQSNDFIFGELQNGLRKLLFNGIGGVPGVLPFAPAPGSVVWPDSPAIRYRDPAAPPPTRPELLALLGLAASTPGTGFAALRNMLKLEAPLAVETRALPGRFVFNKFSSMPFIIEAARIAQNEAFTVSSSDLSPADTNKRLMIVPKCHVKRLVTTPAGAGQRVTRVETDQGTIDLPPGGMVILALGTIESTRVCLDSFRGIPNYGLIGRNLLAHLRSNLTIRIPVGALPAPHPLQLQTAALFVKGAVGGRFFHLQITASGGGTVGTDSEARLFRTVPDVDLVPPLRASTDNHVVITIRGLGEMEPQNPNSGVTLDPELDEFGVPRAFVRLTASANDMALWNAMDAAADAVALAFANGQSYEVVNPPQGPPNELLPVPAGQAPGTVMPIAPNSPRRDQLGTTFHEAGTLWMGDDPNTSVTNADGRMHFVDNAYLAGPALVPSTGSPNPMLTGVALARRTAVRIVARHAPPITPLAAAEQAAGFQPLFDGTEALFTRWRQVGPNSFALIDGEIVTYGSQDFSLLYYAVQTFGDFTLRLQFRLTDPGADNSGVFVRFRNPLLRPTAAIVARDVAGGNHIPGNKAWIAVWSGFEIQIDEQARPNGDDRYRTGAVYNIPTGPVPPPAGQQGYQRGAALAAGQWNNYEIQVQGDVYTVRLNGVQTSTFTRPNPAGPQFQAEFQDRGLPPDPANPLVNGYIGLQSYSNSRVAFRHIRVGP